MEFTEIKREKISLTLKDAPNIISESILYQNIQNIHREYDDFIEGDLSDRIESFNFYELIEIDFEKLDLDEWYINESLVEEIKEEIELNIDTMPICVIDDDFSIIDGIHRLNALKKLGYSSIKVYKGLKND